MIFKFFYDRHLAQASYLIGCAGAGEALVIDPSRDITPYLEIAQQEGLRITQVTETHIHADYVSGSRELAHATNATLYLSDEGDADWKYGYQTTKTILVKDGFRWQLGNVQIEVLATPGHTPEHIAFLVSEGDKQIPVGLVTGDSLFVGSVGRPDLLEKAAGIANTMERGARQQFYTMQRLKQLPDYIQIWPGHGAGSACGKSLGGMPFSTLGYEKLMNEGLQFDDEDAFAAWLLSDQPEPPFYFAQMKQVNKIGPALLETLPPLVPMPDPEIDAYLAKNAQIIDTRHGPQFATAHLQGTINIPATSNNFATYAGWFVDYTQPLYLIAAPSDIDKIMQQLRSIGVDNVHGYWTEAVVAEAVANGTAVNTPQITATTLADNLDEYYILDVRNATEHDGNAIPTATHIMMGYVVQHLDTLPQDKPIVVQCRTGVRSQIVASILQKHGVTNLYNLEGGIQAWQILQFA